MKYLFLLISFLMISACDSKKIEGEYVGKAMTGESFSLTFKPNGKLLIVIDVDGKQNKEPEMDYRADGDKVNIAGRFGAIPITQNDDGSLNAPYYFGGLLTKK